MRVLFINDSTSALNWGDRAAAVSLREMIAAVGGCITHSISENELLDTRFGGPPTLAEGIPEGSRKETVKQFVPPILLRLRRKLRPHCDCSPTRRFIPERWEGFEESARAVIRKGVWPTLLEALQHVDVVVIHGDGSMVGNDIHPRSLLFLSYLIKEHFDTPVIIVNHTVDLDHPDLRKMAEHVYPLFDDVVFRDPVSVERCKALCNGRFSPDTAFWFEPARSEMWAPIAGRLTYFDVWPDEARFDPSEPFVCIGGSSLLRFVKKPASIVAGYTSLIEHVGSRYPGRIVLTVSDLNDQAVFRPIAERLKLPLVSLTTPVQQAVDILGNADAYIGGRWHPGIFALRGGTPIVPLSARTFKMQALTDLAGLSSATFDALNLTEEQEAIGRQLLFYLEQGTELRDRLRSLAEKSAEDSWENVSYLRKGLTSRS